MNRTLFMVCVLAVLAAYAFGAAMYFNRRHKKWLTKAEAERQARAKEMEAEFVKQINEFTAKIHQQDIEVVEPPARPAMEDGKNVNINCYVHAQDVRYFN